MAQYRSHTSSSPETDGSHPAAEETTVCICTINRAGIVLDIAESNGDIYKRLVAGDDFVDHVDVSCRGQVKKMIGRHFRSRSPGTIEYTYTDSHGNRNLVRASWMAAPDFDGRSAAYIVARHLAPRKTADLDIKERGDRYRQLSNLTSEGVVICNQGIAVECNDILLHLTGFSREEIIGGHIDNILVPESRVILEEPPAKERSEQLEAKLHIKGGGSLPVEIQVSQVRFQGVPAQAVSCRDISIRKQAMEDLRKLHAAIERSYSSIVITNKKGIIEYVNPAFTATTGYSLEEAIGQNPSMLKTDLHDRKYYGELWRTILSGKVWEGEFLNRKKDGTEYWERAVITPVFDDNKQITHFLAVKDDITDRKVASEALKQSEDKHRIVSELISDYVYRFEMDGESDFSLNWTSGAFEKITGYTEAEINTLGHRWLSIIHPFDREKIQRRYANNMSDATALRSEYRIITKSGDIRWLSDFVQPIYNSEGNVHAIMGAVQDITARKLAEEALRASEANMNLLLKVIPDHIFVFNREGIFTKVFGNERDTVFRAAESFVGQPYTDIFPKKLTALFDKHLKSAFETGELQTFEYKSDGIEDIVYFEARLITTGTEQVIAVLRDITEKKSADSALRRAMEAAEKANRSKSAFLANMSHEIRTPINAVLGFADLLHGQVQEPLQKSYLKSIISSGTTLMTLLNDILDLSKIEAGKMGINPTKVDLGGILEELKHIFALKANKKGIEYSIEMEARESCLYEVDELRLRQILLNLVDNAIKFTDSGMVRVSVRSREIHPKNNKRLVNLEIKVEDSGIGIPEEYQDKIFKAFVQKEEQDKRKYGGTGLGLAITKRIVHLMGGEITLDSTPEVGSTFTVIIPEVATYRLPSLILYTGEEEDMEVPHVHDKVIVIVEKDALRRRELKAAFRGAKNSFIEVDGVEYIDSRSLYPIPDLIIVSAIDTPEEVFSARKHLRDIQMIHDVPLLMLQPYDEQEVTKACPRDPLCMILQKPVKADRFFRAITAHLAHDGRDNDTRGAEHAEPMAFEENQALIQQLENELMPRWESTAISASFTEIEMFAEEIGEIAERYDNKNLRLFSKQLMVHAHHFDIDNMHALLGGFPKLVDDLKKSKSA
jgi:PAS domain S-box-containing protein